jgi:hypothetical protein
MILTWPAELPRPERQTWALTPQEARRKRQPDAGPPGYRRRFTSVARLVTMSVLLTRNGRAIFDRFFHEDCAEGSLNFWMPDPTTDGWPMLTSAGVPVLNGAGLPVLLSARWLCAWGDQMPGEAVQGTEFRKTFGIVVLP